MSDQTIGIGLRISADVQKAVGAVNSVKSEVDGLSTSLGNTGTEAARASDDVALGMREQEAALESLRRALDPVYANSMQYEAALTLLDAQLDQGNLSLIDHQNLVDAAAVKYLSAATSAQQYGNFNQIAAGQVGNLGAQINDIGVMMAAGQNPLQLALQQGTQITQVIGPLGAAGAVKALRQAFLSVINPVSLVTIGSIAAGAAMFQWLTSAGEETKDVTELLKDLEGQIDEIQRAMRQSQTDFLDELSDKYGAVTEEVIGLETALRDLARQELILQATDGLGVFGDDINSTNALIDFVGRQSVQDLGLTGGGARLAGSLNRERVAPLQDALQAFQGADSVEDQLTTIRAVVAEWNKIKPDELNEDQIGFNQSLLQLLQTLIRIDQLGTRPQDTRARDLIAELVREQALLLAVSDIDVFRIENQEALAAATAEQQDRILGLYQGIGELENQIASEATLSRLEDELALTRELDPLRRAELEMREELAVMTDEQREQAKQLLNDIEAERRAQEALEAATRASTDAYRGLRDEAARAFNAMIYDGEKATDVLRNLARALQQAITNAALFGTGPFAGVFGTSDTGGALGSLIAQGIGAATGTPPEVGAATGGLITGPGGPTDDLVPARLSNGEFVVNAAATAAHLDLLYAINSGSMRRFAEGGLVGRGASAGTQGLSMTHNHFHVSAPNPRAFAEDRASMVRGAKRLTDAAARFT